MRWLLRLAALLASVSLASAGTSLRTTATGGATTGTADRTATITPAVGDLFVVFCNVEQASPNETPTVTDNNGSGTYDRIEIRSHGTTRRLSAHVRTALIENTTSTVVTCATGTNTAGSVVVLAFRGMPRAGSSAVLQSIGHSAQPFGTPAPAFASTTLSKNITIGAIGCADGANFITPPTSWTERADIAQASNAESVEVVTRDSGFAGTTITWGSATGTEFADILLEMNTDGTVFGSEGNLGSTNSKVNGTSIVLTTTATAEVGHLVIVAVGKDNTGTSDDDTGEVTGVVDSSGVNVYTKARGRLNGSPGAAGGADGSIWYSLLTSQLASGGTITASWSSAVDAKAIAAAEFTVASGNTISVEQGVAGSPEEATTSTSAALSAMTGSIEYLFISNLVQELNGGNGYINDSDYNTMNRGGTSGSTADTNISVNPDFRIGTRTSDTNAPTNGATSADLADVFVALKSTTVSAGRRVLVIP